MPPICTLFGCSTTHGQSLSNAAKDGISMVNDRKYRFVIPYLEVARERL
jgi:hypothetical protein